MIGMTVCGDMLNKVSQSQLNTDQVLYASDLTVGLTIIHINR